MQTPDFLYLSLTFPLSIFVEGTNAAKSAKFSESAFKFKFISASLKLVVESKGLNFNTLELIVNFDLPVTMLKDHLLPFLFHLYEIFPQDCLKRNEKC